MTGNHSYLETVTYHDHGNFLYTEFLFKIFRMSGVSEAFACHRPLVERSCHEHIYISFLDILYRSFKRYHGCLCRLGSRLARLHENVLRKAVDDIHSFLVYILCRRNHVCVYLLQVMYLLLVESEDL